MVKSTAPERSMAAMTAREFADEVVAPTIREFMEAPDQRRGYLGRVDGFDKDECEGEGDKGCEARSGLLTA